MLLFSFVLAFFFFFFFLLVCFVLISLLVQYFSKVPLYTCNIVLYISPMLYKHSLQYIKLSVISSFYLIVYVVYAVCQPIYTKSKCSKRTEC